MYKFQLNKFRIEYNDLDRTRITSKASNRNTFIQEPRHYNVALPTPECSLLVTFLMHETKICFFTFNLFFSLKIVSIKKGKKNTASEAVRSTGYNGKSKTSAFGWHFLSLCYTKTCIILFRITSESTEITNYNKHSLYVSSICSQY